MKIKLCNVHKLALSNESEERKPIHIPFGTWDYDESITQTLDRPHAENIANELAGMIEAGEPGIPVYQGHPDVPEYAGKYPDKGALGWVKKILVNENGMDLFVDWDRDPGKGFGWFSPYWVGDKPKFVGSNGKKNVVVDGLNSIGLVNNPNIREFRLANEAQEERKPMNPFQLPQNIIDLANEFDESKHPRDDDGKFSSTGGGVGAAKSGEVKPDQNMRGSVSAYIGSKSTRADKAKAANNMLDLTRGELKSTASDINNLFGDVDPDYVARARRGRRSEVKAVHVEAIRAGLKYNRSTHQYE